MRPSVLTSFAMKVWIAEGEHEKDMKFRCSKLYQKVRKKTRDIYFRVMLRSEKKNNYSANTNTK